MKRCFFRVDASLEIGTGHVMRCLTLAKALREYDIQCAFICREHEGHLGELIRKNAFDLFFLTTEIGSDLQTDSGLAHSNWLHCSIDMDVKQTRQVLPEKIDCLIVDHYALDARWESQMRSVCQKIVVIDDLADREHDCDILLDQNLGTTEADYSNLVPTHCIKLIGPKFALLRPEFAQWREYSLQRRHGNCLRKILVSMGGIDQFNVTSIVLKALSKINVLDGVQVFVVMGDNAPFLDDVRSICQEMLISTTVLTNVNNMAELMANSDLVIGAVGATTWERFCLGIPSICIPVAHNQEKLASFLALNGLVYLINDVNLIEEGMIDFFNKEYPSFLWKNDKVCAVTDGTGCKRLINKIFSVFN